MREKAIRLLTAADEEAAVELAQKAGLRYEGILHEGSLYWGAFDSGALIGVMGCEYQGAFALLRTAGVMEGFRGRGTGSALLEALLTDARAKGVDTVYLFSTDTGSYWLQKGFMPAEVSELVERLPDAFEVGLFRTLGWLPTEVAYKLKL